MTNPITTDAQALAVLDSAIRYNTQRLALSRKKADDGAVRKGARVPGADDHVDWIEHCLVSMKEARDYLAARLAAPAVAEGWQPIETAPKDRPVIVTNGEAVGEAQFHESGDGWWWAGSHPTDAHDGEVWNPTLWQPLPAAPQPVVES